jgi:predicted ArsR family transcriptional regulator
MRWGMSERILETTRGRVLGLLRRADMTADELATALSLTDNAVRAHLATLERDGLVRSIGERREGRIGKPATLYAVTPAVDSLFSKAYLPLLTALLAELGERHTRRELTALLANVGSRLAAGAGPSSGALRERVEAASNLLNQLGGLSSVEEVEPGRGYVIQSRGCPVGSAVKQQPAVCQAIVALVAELTGAEVSSCCQRTGQPSCCFEVHEQSKKRRG